MPEVPIRSTIPARLDRLGWTPFHTRMVAGLVLLLGLACNITAMLLLSHYDGQGGHVSSAVSSGWARAGGVIAFYQIGYGIAAFGVGNLVDHGESLSAISAGLPSRPAAWLCSRSGSLDTSLRRSGHIRGATGHLQSAM